jgi:metal-responsive CopG/Arc/MetJ family transcriptional regulator
MSMCPAMVAKSIEEGSVARVFSLRLPESQSQALSEIIASDPSATRGGIIRDALNEYLKRHYGGKTGAA